MYQPTKMKAGYYGAESKSMDETVVQGYLSPENIRKSNLNFNGRSFSTDLGQRTPVTGYSPIFTKSATTTKRNPTKTKFASPPYFEDQTVSKQLQRVLAMDYELLDKAEIAALQSEISTMDTLMRAREATASNQIAKLVSKQRNSSVNNDKKIIAVEQVKLLRQEMQANLTNYGQRGAALAVQISALKSEVKALHGIIHKQNEIAQQQLEDSKADVQQHKSDLLSTIRELQSQLELAHNRNKELNKSLQSVVEESVAKEVELAQHMEQIEADLENYMSVEKLQRKETECILAQKMDELAKIASANEELLQNEQKQKVTISALQDHLQDMRSSIAHAQSALKEREDAFLKTQAARVQSENAHLEKQNQLQQRLQLLEETNGDLLSKLVAAESVLHSSTQKQVAEARQLIKQAQAALEQERERNKALELQLEETITEVKSKDSAIVALKRRIGDFETDVEASATTQHELREQLQQTMDEVSLRRESEQQLKQELKTSQLQLIEMKECQSEARVCDVARLNTENSELLNQILIKEKEYAQTLNELQRDTLNELNALDQSLAQKRQRVTDLELQLAEAKQQVAALNATVQSIRSENTSKEEQLLDVKRALTENLAEQKQSVQRILGLESELQQSRQQLELRSVGTTESQLQLEQQIAALNATVHQLQSGMSLTKEQLSDTERLLSEKAVKQAQSVQRIYDLESQLQQSKQQLELQASQSRPTQNTATETLVLQQHVRDLQQQLQQRNNEHQTLLENQMAVHAESQSKVQELAAVQQELASTKATMKHLQSEKEFVEAQKSNMEQELLTAKEAAVQLASGKVSSTELVQTVEVKTLQLQIQQLMADVNQKNEENAMLEKIASQKEEEMLLQVQQLQQQLQQQVDETIMIEEIAAQKESEDSDRIEGLQQELLLLQKQQRDSAQTITNFQEQLRDNKHVTKATPQITTVIDTTELLFSQQCNQQFAHEMSKLHQKLVETVNMLLDQASNQYGGNSHDGTVEQLEMQLEEMKEAVRSQQARVSSIRSLIVGLQAQQVSDEEQLRRHLAQLEQDKQEAEAGLMRLLQHIRQEAAQLKVLANAAAEAEDRVSELESLETFTYAKLNEATAEKHYCETELHHMKVNRIIHAEHTTKLNARLADAEAAIDLINQEVQEIEMLVGIKKNDLRVDLEQKATLERTLASQKREYQAMIDALQEIERQIEETRDQLQTADGDAQTSAEVEALQAKLQRELEGVTDLENEQSILENELARARQAQAEAHAEKASTLKKELLKLQQINKVEFQILQQPVDRPTLEEWLREFQQSVETVQAKTLEITSHWTKMHLQAQQLQSRTRILEISRQELENRITELHGSNVRLREDLQAQHIDRLKVDKNVSNLQRVLGQYQSKLEEYDALNANRRKELTSKGPSLHTVTEDEVDSGSNPSVKSTESNDHSGRPQRRKTSLFEVASPIARNDSNLSLAEASPSPSSSQKSAPNSHNSGGSSNSKKPLSRRLSSLPSFLFRSTKSGKSTSADVDDEVADVVHDDEERHGKALLTSDMFTLQDTHDPSNPNDVLELTQRNAQLLEKSNSSPGVLLGWQVLIESMDEHRGVHPGIYVIIGFRRNAQRQFEHKLGHIGDKDHWVRLKRAEHKTGMPFVPQRKVLDI